jgi:predicted ArsR family transcriptional regulator
MPRIVTPPDTSIRATRAVSRHLHGGARYRIEIGAAIARSKLVNTVELADALDLTRQSVHQEIQALERTGLLTRAPQGSNRKVFFMKEPSAYWDWCAEAATLAEEMLDRVPRF